MIRSHLLLISLCTTYGLFFSLGKIALRFVDPIFLTGVRMILAGGILLIYQYLYNKSSLIIKKDQFFYIFLIAITGIYLTNVCEFWGLQFMSAGKTCFIYCSSPIVTAIISYFMFAEKITIKKIIGLSIGILGFSPLLLTQNPVEDLSGNFFFLSYAEISLIIAAIATSIGWILVRKKVKFQNMDIVVVNGFSMVLGGIIAMIHSYYTETWDPIPVTDLKNFIIWLLVLTIVSNIICYNLHAYLLRIFTATYITFAGLSDPFFAAFFGWALLGEVLPTEFWVSITCVVLGLSIYYREELKTSRKII